MPIDLRAARRLTGVAMTAVLASCAEEPPPMEPLPPPIVRQASVSAGPHNVLSAVVTASFLESDSAAVRFGVAGGPLDSMTPAVPVGAGPVVLPVLGLLPSTSYRLQLVCYGAGGVGTSDTLSLATQALPSDLPVYSAGGTNPGPGFVAFGADPYGVVIDNTGRVVWYRRLDGGPTLNFQVQPTGRYTTSPIAPPAGDATPWVEFDPLGDETRRMGCAGGLIARFHELLEESDGSYWLLCDDVRVMDLTPYGGQPGASVVGSAVQHVAAGGELLFSWTPFDHFAITDLDSASRTGATVNWTHGNAIAFAADGGLLVSFRSLNEVTKIDPVTGAVRWRMGGRANQFQFTGATHVFAGQHGLREVVPGILQLLDNRGLPADSRAVRYRVDEVARTVEQATSYFAAPPVTALLGGSTQAMAGGRILVAYGNGNRVQEYDATGAVVWEIHGNPGYVFRAQRIISLYQPGVPGAR